MSQSSAGKGVLIASRELAARSLLPEIRRSRDLDFILLSRGTAA